MYIALDSLATTIARTSNPKMSSMQLYLLLLAPDFLSRRAFEPMPSHASSVMEILSLAKPTALVFRACIQIGRKRENVVYGLLDHELTTLEKRIGPFPLRRTGLVDALEEEGIKALSTICLLHVNARRWEGEKELVDSTQASGEAFVMFSKIPSSEPWSKLRSGPRVCKALSMKASW
ncbi:hypothetical protein KC360_g33 [Hortaea werneckii]|nr:hypothetical protein KC360_g33 [Hortaea werneckii]